MNHWILVLEIPLSKPLPSLANWRGHWRALAALKQAQRHQLALHLRARGGPFLREWAVMRGNEALRMGVTLTRVSPRTLDAHDNLRTAFKAIVDQLAEAMGMDDRSKRYEWTYVQERGAPAYRVRLEVLTSEVVR
jgi:hypothetical protein